MVQDGETRAGRFSGSSGVPLAVFFHGWGSHPLAYRSLVSEWQDLGASVWCPSLPGHAGEPALDGGAQSLAGLGRWAAQEAGSRVLAGDPPPYLVLAGHSLGGAIASLAARELAAQGVACSLLLLSPAGASPVFGPRQWVRAARGGTGGSVSSALVSCFRYPVRNGLLGWSARTADLLALWGDLAAAGMPITGVSAVGDTVLDADPVRDVPGVQGIVVPGGHYWPLLRPDLSRTALEQHLVFAGSLLRA